MSPSAIHSNAPYTSISQSHNRSSLIYALLFTLFLFVTLGSISQISPSFPPQAPNPASDEVAVKRPPLIPPQPPKPIEQKPEQTLIPIFDPVPQQIPITQIPNIRINSIPTKPTSDKGIGLFPGIYAPPIFDLSHLDTQPIPITRAIPVHPYEKKKAGIGGNVLVEFLIDPTGRVVEAHIIQSSDPSFNQPTLKAIRKWTFTPALKDRIAVWTHARVPFEFSVNK